MRTFGSILAVLAALSAPAAASDLYSAKDPVVTTGNVYNPSIAGFYAEVAIGPSISSPKANLFSTGLDLGDNGGYVGGRFGYDAPFPNLGKHFGLGVFGEVGTGFGASGSALSALSALTWSQNVSYGAGVKAFYDYGTGQFYAFGGWAGADESVGLTGLGKESKFLNGYEVGGGVSALLFPHVYGFAEYERRQYADSNIGGVIKWSQDDNQFKVGLGFVTGSLFTPLK
jgi:hypothetical protein